MIGSRDYINAFYYDMDFLQKQLVIKKDPYRYLLPPEEIKKAENSFKRALFYLGLPALYLYKNIRQHYELSRLKKLSLSSVTLLQMIPKTILGVIVLYFFSYTFFVDYEKLKMHKIAKIEIQKFDEEYFTYDEFKYAIMNAPAYQSPESVFGRIYPRRLPFSYFQTAGWIKRRRDKNPHIMEEVPPKYEFTPKGPRAGTNFKEIENKPLPFLLDTRNV
jgi:hypothetical protein